MTSSLKILDIPGFSKYAVSTNGDVYSFAKYKEGRLLKQKTIHNGYKLVQLGRDNYKLVHRLVAETFIPNPENKRTVNHINSVKTDNRLENLEWNTYSENHKHAYKNGRATNAKRIAQYDLQGNFIKYWFGVYEINRATGFNRGNINSCCNNKIKTANGFKWKYE